ncbi:hypothetical protein LZ554_005700 [Drepanopeziza brunnea f. sp. 'monogermtubi']|nr:hypothetical protein LZ554_005700 [Drepanopeziza brunnea f. sp. 'monogermtubi']
MGVLKRKNRAERNSNSDEYDDATESCTIELYMSARDPYRVVANPRYPLPWPYHVHKASSDGDDIFDAVAPRIHSILQAHGITPYTEILKSSSPKFTKSKERDHLLIYTKDENNETWNDAATAIQEMIDREISMSRPPKGEYRMRVEIRNHALMLRDTSSAVHQGTKEFTALEMTQNVVAEFVQNHIPQEWTSVSWVMRGSPENYDNRIPTVLVAVKQRSIHHWEIHENQMRKKIEDIPGWKDLDFDIAVNFVSGSNMLYASREMDHPLARLFDRLGPRPDCGASIGPRTGTVQPDAGTLGVWVNFLPFGSEAPIVCFLTCHHVISLGAGSPASINQINTNGIALDGASASVKIIVDHPSPHDARHTIDRLQNAINKGSNSSDLDQQDIDNIRNRQRTGGIGFVRHSSGIMRRSPTGNRYDWALIEVPDRRSHGQNKPIFRSETKPGEMGVGSCEITRSTYDDVPGEIISSMALVTEQTVTVATRGGVGARVYWGFKKGRTTDVTSGEIPSFKTFVNWGDNSTSWEHHITGSLGGFPFAQGGDAGSLIHNVDKEWMGILTGASSHDEAGYFISAKDVMDDIAAHAGGTITLVGKD